MEGGRGVSRPPGAKAESLVPSWTFPTPSPASIFVLETSRTRCPRGLLSSARIAAEGTEQAGCRSSAAAEGALAQRTNGRAHLWLPGPGARVLLQRAPSPHQSKGRGFRRVPQAGRSPKGEHTCGGGGVPGWGAEGRPGAGPRSRGAAAVEPRPVPTDVLEAPSMGCGRDGGLMEVSFLGVLLGFGALLWATGSNDNGGLSLCSRAPPGCLKWRGACGAGLPG